MTETNESTHIFRANQEHAGVRVVVLLTFFLSFFLVITLLNTVLRGPDGGRADVVTPLICLLTLPLALGLTWTVEKLLKRYWPSGDQIVVDETGIRARLDDTEKGIAWSDRPDLLLWHFALRGFQRGGRERRVARNWVCLSVQLQHNQSRIIAHTYAPQRRAAALRALQAEETPFFEIEPGEVYDTSLGSRITPPTRPEIPASVLAGKDGRYWLAERNRWREGLELTPTDFEKLLLLIAVQETAGRRQDAAA